MGCASVSAGGPSTGKSAISNPSGSCIAPDDGARAGYHSPAGSTWLPDCQNTLKREYWRVFAQSPTSAYIIPRPDGAAEMVAVCAEPSHELRELAQKYTLCSLGASPADIERINDMDPADALRITHHLHGNLKFVSTGSGITPYPLPSDIVDACALQPAANSSDLEAMCERERERLASGHHIGFAYEDPGASELALRLNELYGIE